MSKQTFPKQSISDTVMQSIQAGTVTMRPRVYFSLLTVLTVLTSIAAGIVSRGSFSRSRTCSVPTT